NQKRFERTTWFHIGLPFFGEWLITQAHNGEHTHKGEWAQAWDFEVRGSNGKTFRSSGNFPEHYFCYNLPVIAAQAGYVVAVEDDIEDNEIGKPNMVKNWGNTVVIKHAEYLYTKVSHLKAGTIEVKVGDYVKKGDLLGNVGNSGRSPVPHLHFQIQATPYIGSKTLWYPIDYYVINNDGNHELHEFEIPQNQQLISSFKTNLLLKKNYEFVLGQKYKVEYEMNGKTYMENWEVFATSLGKKYVFCHETRALAYFVNDESNFYFTDYQGHRKGALYYYFLCSYKVMLGFYQGAQVRDSVALHQVYSQYALFAHDFVAPFTTLAQVHYELNYQHVDDPMFSREMLLNGKLSIKSIFNTRDFLHFELKIEEDAYQQLSVTNNKLNFKAKIISE
ncbi:peptidoglycan DD-metalloendopeptidase family protein, partial [bacterium]|nr:peptidoglycan DD-metalloendopeptidase family protein [bacterium]